VSRPALELFSDAGKDDLAEKIIRVEQSKGRKDRNVMLSAEMLALLRQCRYA
jgi:hypothetical protein